ncbi:MAG: cupin domain-containing protein [Candidatus Bipolaricaulota bacterium]|nr:MAG: cupin domain-containing protein [Candidatus Bipolaricaulota bacterium]
MAHVHHRESVPAVDLHDGETIHHVAKRVLVGAEQGAENFVMRQFTLGENGATPYHSHPWEHEVFVLNGRGKIVTEEGELPLTPGDAAFVAPDEVHRFMTVGSEPLEFLCIVPTEGEG